MASFNNLGTNFLIMGILLVCFFAFIIQIQDENNAPNQFINNPLISKVYGNLTSKLDTISSSAQTQKNLFESENPVLASGSLIFYSVISFGKVFTAIFGGLFDVMVTLPVAILGVNPIVIGVLTGLFIFSLIVAIWLWYKVGG